MARERSPNFVYSYRPGDPAGAKKLAKTRKAVAEANSQFQSAGLTHRLRVAQTPHISGDSEHYWKYSDGRRKSVRIEDADRVDVYVIPR